MSERHQTLAFVGGTGKEGRGLALRLAAAGHPVVIGSRSGERAVQAASHLEMRLTRAGTPAVHITGMLNCDALRPAEIVFLTVPFASLDGLLAECGALLAGRVVVDVVVPLRFVDGRFDLVPVLEGSASQRIQRLAPQARVIAGFKNVAASHLQALESPVHGDILLAGEDEQAKATVAALVGDIPVLRAIDAGPLANARFLESLTALELNLNRLHKTSTAVKILGIQ